MAVIKTNGVLSRLLVFISMKGFCILQVASMAFSNKLQKREVKSLSVRKSMVPLRISVRKTICLSSHCRVYRKRIAFKSSWSQIRVVSFKSEERRSWLIQSVLSVEEVWYLVLLLIERGIRKYLTEAMYVVIIIIISMAVVAEMESGRNFWRKQ